MKQGFLCGGVFLVVLALCLPVVCSAVQGVQEFEITDLGQNFYPEAITDGGFLVGNRSIETATESYYVASWWNAGSFGDLPNTLGGSTTYAYSVAPSPFGGAYIAGSATTTQGGEMPALWYNDQDEVFHLMTYPTLGGPYGWFMSVNAAGLLLGSAATSKGNSSHAFVVCMNNPENLIDVGTLFGTGNSSGIDINANGNMAGSSATDNSFVYHAFTGTVTETVNLCPIGYSLNDIGTLGGTSSYSSAINDNGQVVGWSSISEGFTNHAFLYDSGEITDLGTLGGTRSSASDINNKGEIVGGADTATGAGHAFIYFNGQMEDLNYTLPPNSGWVLTNATAINNNSQIVGLGQKDGYLHGFLLSRKSDENTPTPTDTPTDTPTPETPTSTPTFTPTPSLRLPDLNSDGKVDGEDIALLIEAYGGDAAFADLNADGKVDWEDLFIFSSFWGVLSGR